VPSKSVGSVIFILALVLMMTARSVAQETFSAKVVGIDDGDTINVLAPGNVQCRVRLAGIDAPEHGQAYGTESQKHLGEVVFGRQVSLDCGKEESYGRKVCKVLLPNEEDVSLDQVKAGLAWHYKQYSFAQTPQDRNAYSVAEIPQGKVTSGCGLMRTRSSRRISDIARKARSAWTSKTTGSRAAKSIRDRSGAIGAVTSFTGPAVRTTMTLRNTTASSFRMLWPLSRRGSARRGTAPRRISKRTFKSPT